MRQHASRGGMLMCNWLRLSRTRKCDFAVELDISRAYLSQIVHGQRRPSLELLARIAVRTGVPITAWLDNQVSEMEKESKSPARSRELAKS